MRTLFKNHGFTLAELMISMGLMSAIALSSGYVTLQLRQTQEGTSAEFWLEIRRQEIISYLKDEANWGAVLDANAPAMDCMKDNTTTNCQGVGGGPFQIIITAGSNSETLQSDQGFTNQGQLCNEFPSMRCRYMAQFRWQPLCRDALCRNPEARLSVQFFKTTDGSLSQLIDSKYVELVRREKIDSQSDICLSVTGNSSCNFATMLNSCPAGRYVVGFDAGGAPDCQPITYSCGGNIMAGFNADGSPICAPGCP